MARSLTEPHGELRLKQVDQDGRSFEFDVNTFVCTKCGHETSYRVTHDRYAAPRASNIPPATVGYYLCTEVLGLASLAR
jgi:hypothetical protein